MKAINSLKAHSIIFALLSASILFASLPPSSGKEEETEEARTYEEALATVKNSSRTLLDISAEFPKESLTELVKHLGIPKQLFDDLVVLAQNVDISSATAIVAATQNYNRKQLAGLITTADYLALTPVLKGTQQSLAKQLVSKNTLEAFNKNPALLAEIEKELNQNTQRATAQMIVPLTGMSDFKISKIFDLKALSVAFSPDGSYIAAGQPTGRITLITQNKLIELQQKAHIYPVKALGFNSQNNQFASGGFEELTLWDMSTQTITKKFEQINNITSIQFSPNGKLLAAADENVIKLWNASTGNSIKVFPGHSKTINAIAFNPTSTQIASASEDGTIILWNIDAMDPVWTLKAHSAAIHGLAFSVDGKKLFSGSSDMSVKIWNPENATLLKKLDQKDYVQSLASKTTILAAGLSSGIINLWDFTTGQLIQALSLGKTAIDLLAFDQSGEKLVANNFNSKTIGIWESEALKFKKLSFKELLVFLIAKEFGPSKLNEKFKATYEGLPEEVKKLI